jgi:hypothetical protein
MVKPQQKTVTTTTQAWTGTEATALDTAVSQAITTIMALSGYVDRSIAFLPFTQTVGGDGNFSNTVVITYGITV